MSKLKQIVSILSFPIVAYSGYQIWDAYSYSRSPSKIELAAEKLGFYSSPKLGEQTQQDALLNIFYLSGYLKPASLWHDINSIGNIKDPGKTFKSIYKELVRSGATQDDPAKFNPKSLRKNFLKSSDLDVQDAEDLLLYIAQHAFNRKAGQERNELTAQSWMNKHKEAYWQSAKELNLIDSIEPPQHEEYQARWIAGASRVGVLARLIYDDYISNLKDVNVTGNTSILAGNRELWANIDGINPKTYKLLLNARQNKINIDNLDISVPIGEDLQRTEEGRQYMLQLAEKSKIRLDQNEPFVQCTAGECPPGRFPGRDYANYFIKTGVKLTESLMAEDLLYSFFPSQKSIIVNTANINDQRPTTATTAKDAAKVLVEEIIAGKHGSKKEFKVLYQTNNPYIERQTLATQQEVDKVLLEYGLNRQGYKIIVEGVGFGCKQDVATVHSEFGALLAEKWKAAAQKDGQAGVMPKRDIKSLLFQTRDNSFIVPEEPDISDIETSGGLKDILVSWFDDYM